MNYQLSEYVQKTVRTDPLSHQMRKAISNSGLTLYRIAKESKVDAAALTRFMQGKSITLTSADRIASVVGVAITVQAPPVTQVRSVIAKRRRRGSAL